MTGVLSSITDHLALGESGLALAGFVALLAFVGGAMTTAWMVNWSLRRQLRSAFARPLVVEAGLLLVFGLFGAAINLSSGLFIPLTVLVLCFIMGLQNALITKISNAEIRTTHVTGLVTDIGIELGKMLYFNRADSPAKVVANRRKLRIHLTLVAFFFIGRRARRTGLQDLGLCHQRAPGSVVGRCCSGDRFCTTSDRVASPRVCHGRTVNPTGRRAPTNAAALRVKPLGAKLPSTLDLKTAHALALP